MDAAAFVVVLAAGMLGLVLAMTNWRHAMLGAILIGFAQDPLRKIVPGEPVYLVGLCAGALVLSMIGASARHGSVSLRPLEGGDPRARVVLLLLVLLVLLQAARCWIAFGSFPMAAIGVLSYLSPFPAIWLGYYFARDSADIRRLLAIYVACAAAVTSGIFLSKAGYESVLLKEVGEGLVLYDPVVGRLELISGFMRAPEVAAWHAGAATCLIVVLGLAFRGNVTRALSPAAVLFFLSAGVLTGRRKMLIIVAAFTLIYLTLLYYYRQRSARRGLMTIAILSCAVISAAMALAPETSYQPYVQRGRTVFESAGERFTGLGLASVGWALDSAGFFGMGAGVTSQGSQHFVTEGLDTARGAAEGGLGKIVMELGVPGLILVLIALAFLVRNVRRALDVAAVHDPALLRLSLGLSAFLAANVPVFVGASQIYGDPFVLILLGSMLGFVLAVPRIIGVRRALQARATRTTFAATQ